MMERLDFAIETVKKLVLGIENYKEFLLYENWTKIILTCVVVALAISLLSSILYGFLNYLNKKKVNEVVKNKLLDLNEDKKETKAMIVLTKINGYGLVCFFIFIVTLLIFVNTKKSLEDYLPTNNELAYKFLVLKEPEKVELFNQLNKMEQKILLDKLDAELYTVKVYGKDEKTDLIERFEYALKSELDKSEQAAQESEKLRSELKKLEETLDFKK